ncbi:hypothetical protein H7Y63_00205 [Polaromonas sp.]|nr:hypothetical protein [Candidatus Saccharibacteria bacterium]
MLKLIPSSKAFESRPAAARQDVLKLRQHTIVDASVPLLLSALTYRFPKVAEQPSRANEITPQPVIETAPQVTKVPVEVAGQVINFADKRDERERQLETEQADMADAARLAASQAWDERESA